MFNEAKYLETAKVFEAAVKGDYTARGRLKQIVDSGTVLNETISTSDLVRTFGRVNQVELERQYAGTSFQWKRFAKPDIREDFRPVGKQEFIMEEDLALASNGGYPSAVGTLPVVPEGTEYPTALNWTTSEKQLGLYKSGLRVGFTFEAIMNDQWGFIQSIPGELFKYAYNTEEREALSTFVSATGPNADFFNSGNQNTVGTVPLTLDNLKAAKKNVRSRKVNGNSVTVSKFVLVVPPAMQDDAEALLKILSVETVDGAGTSTEIRTTQSTSNGDVELVVSDHIGRIDVSAKVDTTWYLLPAGGNDGTRDSIVLGFLRGHEKPQFTIATTNHTYPGGGAVPWTEGSLRNDSTESRIRHIVSGGFWNATSCYASTGS